MPDLKVKELAAELHIGEDKARALIHAGLVRSYKLGPKTTRIPSSELDRIRGGSTGQGTRAKR